MIEKIVSGAQTGVDRAALDAAMEQGFECGGWCPRGRLAEDGVIPEHYPVHETRSRRYTERTRLNVEDSDATLVLARGRPSGGTGATIRYARRAGRPCLVIDLDSIAADQAVERIRAWLAHETVRVLNVAGPRESGDGEIYVAARGILDALLETISNRE